MKFRIVFLILLSISGSALFGEITSGVFPKELPPGLAEYLQPEDSPSLFNYELDDAAVDLLLFGSWKSQGAAAFGRKFIPTDEGYLSYSTPLPSLGTIPFKNTIDLLLSLWINSEFFLELNFQDKFRDNTILLGYSSLDPDFWLQALWVGNTAIGIKESPLIPTLGIKNRSPGILGKFQSALGTHEAFIRLETSGYQERFYLGNREIVQTEFSQNSLIRGKYFLLPYTIEPSQLGELRVWSEITGESGLSSITQWTSGGTPPTQTSSQFRLLQPGSDYFIQGPTGQLSLNNPAKGRILVELPDRETTAVELPFLRVDLSSGIAKLDSTGPQGEIPFSINPDHGFTTHILTPLDELEDPDSILKVPGGIDRILFTRSDDPTKQGILFYDPGRFSPFEILGYYLKPDGKPGSRDIQNTVSGLYVPSPGTSGLFAAENLQNSREIQVLPLEKEVRIYPNSGDSIWSIRWPLEAVIPGASFEYFFPPDLGGKVLVPIFLNNGDSDQREDTLFLEPGIPPGSIQVFRDMGSDSNPDDRQTWVYNPQTGSLVLTPPPGFSEFIGVRYSGTQFSGNRTSIILGTQHKIALLSLHIPIRLGGAIFGVIPLKPNEQNESEFQGLAENNPAIIESRLSGSLEGDWGSVLLGISGFIQNPNPYGARHYLGIGPSIFQGSIMKNRHHLGPPPYFWALENSVILKDGLSVPDSIPELSQMNRAVLFYNNPYPSGFPNQLPLVLDDPRLTSTDAEIIRGKTREGIMNAGPFAVLGNQSSLTQIKGLGYRLDMQFDEDEIWAGFQIPLSIQQPGEPQALLLTLGATTEASLPEEGFHIFLQIGRLSEDMNTNKIFDGGSSGGPRVNTGTSSQGTTQISGSDWLKEFQLGLETDFPSEDLNSDGFLQTTDGYPIQTVYLGKISQASKVLTTTGDSKLLTIPLPPEVAALVQQTTTNTGSNGGNISQAGLRIVVIRENFTPSDPPETSLGGSLVVGNIALAYPRAQAIGGNNGTVTTFPGIPNGVENPLAFFSDLPGGNLEQAGGYSIVWNSNGQPADEPLFYFGVSTPELISFQNLGIQFYWNPITPVNEDFSLKLRDVGGFGEAEIPLSRDIPQGWYFLEFDLINQIWSLSSQSNHLEITRGTHSLTPQIQGITLMVSQNSPDPSQGVFHLHRVTGFQPQIQVQGQAQFQGKFHYNRPVLKWGNVEVLGHPWIESTGTYSVGNKSGSGNLNLDSGLTIFESSIILRSQFTSGATQNLQFLGHSFNILKNLGWIGIQEDFLWHPVSPNQHTDYTIKSYLGTEELLRINASAGLFTTTQNQTKRWNLDVIHRRPSGWTGSLALRHSQVYDEAPLLDYSNYPTALYQNYSGLFPEVQHANGGRSYDGKVSLEIPATPKISFVYNAGLGIGFPLNQITTARLNHNQTFGSTFLLPFSTILGFQYRWKSSSEVSPRGFTSLSDDMEIVSEVLGENTWLLFPISIQNSLDNPDPDSTLFSYTTEPEVEVTLQRRISASLVDIYLPVSAGITFQHINSSNPSKPGQIAGIGIQTGFTPINLFGSQGILPLGLPFLSDEYSYGLGYQGIWAPEHLSLLQTISLRFSSTLYGIGYNFSDQNRNSFSPPDISGSIPYTLELSTHGQGIFAPNGGMVFHSSSKYSWKIPIPDPPEFLQNFMKDETWTLSPSVLGSFGFQIPTSGGTYAISETGARWYSETARTINHDTSQTPPFLGLVPTKVTKEMGIVILGIQGNLNLPQTGFFRVFMDFGWEFSQITNEVQRNIHHISTRLGFETILNF